MTRTSLVALECAWFAHRGVSLALYENYDILSYHMQGNTEPSPLVTSDFLASVKW